VPAKRGRQAAAPAVDADDAVIDGDVSAKKTPAKRAAAPKAPAKRAAAPKAPAKGARKRAAPAPTSDAGEDDDSEPEAPAPAKKGKGETIVSPCFSRAYERFSCRQESAEE
jgi:hypothetical protein